MTIRTWAKALKRDALTLWLAARDPRVAWYAKALAGAVAAYAFSPVDLIPDFIPVLGYLDDLLIVPAGIWLAVRMIEPAVLADLRGKAAVLAQRPVSRLAAALIAGLWLALAVLAARLALPHVRQGA
ncbi:DUF1232 domain-containing protein [Novosphingobium sp.]|uniref:YkvA family protein n=1 Tax=Novosphingobium sp. TaxID=1874826 RepID=UPI0025D86FC3|nr:DUF1232 domain-containing protein [Novosphingobium sp.]